MGFVRSESALGIHGGMIMVRILRRRWKLIVLTFLVCLVAAYLGLSLLIGQHVRQAVAKAQLFQPGDPVAALLAVVHSPDKSLEERDQAVWALGQMGDPVALGPLERLYTGEPCDHEFILCQKELKTAIELCGGEYNISALIWRHGELASQ